MALVSMPRREFTFGRMSMAILFAGLVSVVSSTPSSAQWVSPGDAYAATAWRGGVYVMPPYYYAPGYGAYAYAPGGMMPGGYVVSPWDGNRPSTFEDPGF